MTRATRPSTPSAYPTATSPEPQSSSTWTPLCWVPAQSQAEPPMGSGGSRPSCEGRAALPNPLISVWPHTEWPSRRHYQEGATQQRAGLNSGPLFLFHFLR